nr:type IVB secretion system protein IcmH/DotU [Bordetella sp. H567]
MVTFHGEASGGERFFTILHHLSRDPAANIDALELLYIILSLGMEGRYRLMEGGAMELEQLRARLLQLIGDTRGTVEQGFSPEPSSVPGRRRPLWHIRPLWLALAISVLMLAATLGIADWRMRGPAQAIMDALGKVYVAVRMPKPAPPPPPPAVPAKPASRFDPAIRQLAAILAPEIANGSVRLDQNGDRAVLTLNSDGLFASGSSWVLPAHVPLLRRIGAALHDVPGDVTIVGHTDDIRPAPGAPSNQELSLRRAGRVKDLLVQEASDPDRFLVQGRGDTEPVAPNDTEAGRGRNRRVVITLVAPGAAR